MRARPCSRCITGPEHAKWAISATIRWRWLMRPLRVRGIDRPAGGRCLDHAADTVRQYQCADHHDCGKGRRSDPAGRNANRLIGPVSWIARIRRWSHGHCSVPEPVDAFPELPAWCRRSGMSIRTIASAIMALVAFLLVAFAPAGAAAHGSVPHVHAAKHVSDDAAVKRGRCRAGGASGANACAPGYSYR